MVVGLLTTLLLAAGAYAIDADLHPQALAVVVAAATTTDPGLLACATIEALMGDCYSSGLLSSTVPIQTEAACLCCYQGANVANKYQSCESYVTASAKTATDAYSLASLGYGICSLAGNVCNAAGSVPTGPVASASITAAASAGSASASGGGGSPASLACSSLVGVLGSCSKANPGWNTMSAKSMASCLCYDTKSNYNTAFDGYASSCAPYAKTAMTSVYSDVLVLETFCEGYPPQTGSVKGSATATAATAAVTKPPSFTGFNSDDPPSSPSSTVTVFAPRASGLAAPAAAGGAAAWAANAVTWVLSVFLLI